MYSGFHLKKDQPAQTYVLAQAKNTAGNKGIVVNKTAIPDAGNFETTALHTDATGSKTARFSSAPQGNVAYHNGKESLIWGGEEHRCAGLINYDPNGTFSYDYSEQISNTKDDAQNVAVLHTVAGGIDTNTKLLLHLDNNITDSSGAPHTVTNNNVTFDAGVKVFGTHSALLNGTTAYLTVPDHADFDFSGGIFTVENRFRSGAALTDYNSIFYQQTYIESVAFTLGASEISAGDTITGKVSAKTAIVDYVDVTGGTWVGGDAAGTIYVHTLSGVFQNEIVTVGGVDSATIAGDFSYHGLNYINFFVDSSGVVWAIVHECYGAGTDVISLSTSTGIIAAAGWYHIELTESGDDWYVFVNGIQRAYVSDSSRAKNYIGVVQIGKDNSGFGKGYRDEIRISKVARHTSDFEVPTEAYSTNTLSAYLKVKSNRPLKAIKLYPKTINTETSDVASVYYWDGAQYVLCTNIVDGTRPGTISLAQAGTISFNSTIDVAKVKYDTGTLVYIYKVYISAVAATTSIYYVTVDAPFQGIKNIWSGETFAPVVCKKYNGTTFLNYTVEVNDFFTDSYADLSSLGTSHYLLLGFEKPQQALQFYFVAGKGNTAAALATVDYGDGAGFTSVGSYTDWDGTQEGTKSFSKTGVISFAGLDKSKEYKQTIDGEGPYYYYKIHFSAALSANVNIFYIAGMENPDVLLPYDFSIDFQNRLLLCSNDADGSEVRISAENTPDVYNGSDSTILNFGGANKLVAGKSVFNRLGSYVYDYTILTKHTETWLLDGYAVSGEGQFTKKRLSERIGCCAPETMCVCEAGLVEEETVKISSTAITWLSYAGPVAFMAGRLVLIKGIEPYFDRNDSRCVNYSYIDKSFGFYDSLNKIYNLLIPSGSGQTTPNAWLMYDILRDKWSRKVPPIYPSCAFPVRDTNGAEYIYLGFSNGYMQRNEYGTTFDGTAITQSVTFSDLLANDSIFEDIRLDFLKLICKAKNTGTAVSISVYHRANADESWTALTSVPMYDTGKRVVKHLQRLNKIGIGHELKFSVTTSDKADGAELIAAGLMYHIERIDTTLGVGK